MRYYSTMFLEREKSGAFRIATVAAMTDELAAAKLEAEYPGRKYLSLDENVKARDDLTEADLDEAAA